MAQYSFTEFCELPASVDVAYQQLTDLAFIQRSYEQRESVVTDVTETPEGHQVVVTRPVGPQLSLLGREARGLQLRLEQQWRDDDNGKAAEVLYRLVGTPVKITGLMQLSAATSGSTLSALLNVHIALPVIGAPLAEKMAKVVQQKVANDFAYQREALASAQ